MKGPILFVGGVTLDLISRVDRFPEEDSRVVGHSLSVLPGGPALVAGVTLARLGAPASVVCPVARDWAGKMVLSALCSEPCTVIPVWTEPPTSVSLIISSAASATRTILAHRGSVHRVTFDDLRHNVDWAAFRTVHLDCVSPELSLDVARWARAKGLTVSIDLHLAGINVHAELLTVADVCVANAAAGQVIDSNLARARGILHDFGPRHVVVTAGKNGCFVWDGSTYHVPAAQVAAVDTTGAGDVFRGAFLYGLLRSWSPLQAARFASAAAALSTTALGGLGFPLTLDGVLKAMEVSYRDCGGSHCYPD